MTQDIKKIKAAVLAKLREQEPLGEPFASVLHENLWNLYEGHPAPSVPEGYALVPIEPTDAMLFMITPASAALSEWRVNYKSMLAAARSDRELQHEHTMKQFQEVCNGRNCYSSKARPAHSEECKADHDACYAAARRGE